jgi:serine/threonine-protein kinase
MITRDKSFKTCPHCGSNYDLSAQQCEHDGSKLIFVGLDNEDIAGKTLNNKYRLIKKLGRGGYGSVYEGIHLTIDRQVAIKVLNPEIRKDEQVIRRFLNEAKSVTKLKHPNTITTYDLDQTEDGILFMVMELVKGKSLEDLASDQKPDPVLPWERLCSIMTQVCDSLYEAHSLNIVHRDLKPSNIMVFENLNQKDFVKVLDFGIAKIIGIEGQTITDKGVIIGTPQYMSPEQCLGQKVDQRSDLYSLGIMLYQLLSGEFPFKATTHMKMMISHTTETPVPLKEAFPSLDISFSLDSLIKRLLAKDPDSRPAGAAELKNELQSIMSENNPETETPPALVIQTAEPMKKIVPATKSYTQVEREKKQTAAGKRRHRMLFIMAVSAAVIAAAASGIYFFSGDRGSQQQPPATEQPVKPELIQNVPAVKSNPPQEAGPAEPEKVPAEPDSVRATVPFPVVVPAKEPEKQKTPAKPEKPPLQAKRNVSEPKTPEKPAPKEAEKNDKPVPQEQPALIKDEKSGKENGKARTDEAEQAQKPAAAPSQPSGKKKKTEIDESFDELEKEVQKKKHR